MEFLKALSAATQQGVDVATFTQIWQLEENIKLAALESGHNHSVVKLENIVHHNNTEPSEYDTQRRRRSTSDLPSLLVKETTRRKTEDGKCFYKYMYKLVRGTRSTNACFRIG